MSARRGEASGTFWSALKIFEPDASKYAARHLLMRQKLNPVFFYSLLESDHLLPNISWIKYSVCSPNFPR